MHRHSSRRLCFDSFLVSSKPILGSSAFRPSMGLISLRRFRMREATNAELTSLDCAASSGFLNLVTPRSARVRTALFHAESVPGIEAFRGFPLLRAAIAFTTRSPQPRARPPRLFSCSVPKNGAPEELRWTPLRSRSEELVFHVSDSAPGSGFEL